MSLIPRPSNPSVSLLNLYRHYTKDTKAPEELIRATMRQDTDNRLLVVSLRMKGYSYHQISGALGIDQKCARTQVQRAMKRIWKILNNVPRYYLTGHPGPKSNRKAEDATHPLQDF